ncbi:MAG TPA: hypothetical protein VIY48_04115 [Candidatus Paceibacterota bacterium]
MPEIRPNMRKINMLKAVLVQDTERPYIFHHRYGTLTVVAQTEVEAELKAKRLARGMPLVPAFTHQEATCQS